MLILKFVMGLSFLVLNCLFVSQSFALNDDQSKLMASKILEEANQEYENGSREKALQFYLQASKYGSADAHFQLYYRYNLDKHQTIYHLEQAFNLGHKKAGDALLEKIFLRSESLFLGNPTKALMVHIRQKQMKQDQKSSRYMETIQRCLGAGLFDATGFLKRYGELENYEKNQQEMYSGWSLAERASRGGITGKRNNKLALQIVCRSSEVPAELMSAVSFLSKNMNDNSKEFNLCNHVTSGMGSGFCSSRERRISDKSFDLKYNNLLTQLSDENKAMLKQAMNAGLIYITKKAQTEERHGGSGRGTWVSLSIEEQKSDLISLFDSVVRLEPVGVETNLVEVKTSMDFVLRQILSQLSEKPIIGEGKLSLTDILTVQESWEDFANKSAKFMYSIDESMSQDAWKAFLMSKRLSHLEKLMANISE